jgi:hypothetical protein
MLPAISKTIDIGSHSAPNPFTITPKVGDCIYRENHSCGELLLAGDNPVDSSYLGSMFRIPTYDKLIPTYPINIEVTGRTLQFKDSAYRIRIKITYVHDGEPNTFGNGWLLVNI